MICSARCPKLCYIPKSDSSCTGLGTLHLFLVFTVLLCQQLLWGLHCLILHVWLTLNVSQVQIREAAVLLFS